MPDMHVVQTDLCFHDAFNRDSFQFSHELHRLALYDIENLVSLARRIGPHHASWSNRPPDLADGWGDTQARERSLEAAVAGIERSNVRVTLRGAEQDPVFGSVFAPVVAEFVANIGAFLQADLMKTRCALVITSPRRMVGYHIDSHAKLLLQLRGERTVSVYDGSDRTVMPDSELEAFYGGDAQGARYKEDQQGTPRLITFRPGAGLHVPVEWPHWVRNGNSLSVALSIQYELRSTQQRAKLYRVNHRLRQLGMSPVPPGRSSWRDASKAALVASLDRLRHHSP